MNKIIILFSFLFVSIIHILFFYFYEKEETKILPISKAKIVQVELSKVTIKQEEITQKPIQKQEQIKEIEKPKKSEKPKKVEKIKEEKLVEKVEETAETKSLENMQTAKISNQTPQISPNEMEENQNLEAQFIDEYGKKLREEINKNKNYPTISKKLKEQGKVTVRFKVHKNGKFDDIQILVSSNKERLDNAALNALYETKEFLPFENKIKKEFLEYNLPLEFILN